MKILWLNVFNLDWLEQGNTSRILKRGSWFYGKPYKATTSSPRRGAWCKVTSINKSWLPGRGEYRGELCWLSLYFSEDPLVSLLEIHYCNFLLYKGLGRQGAVPFSYQFKIQVLTDKVHCRTRCSMTFINPFTHLIMIHAMPALSNPFSYLRLGFFPELRIYLGRWKNSLLILRQGCRQEL